MALLQISEPGGSDEKVSHKVSIGIDLGTTNSLVATVKENSAQTIKDEDGSDILPSVVQFHADNSVTVGHEALNTACENAENTIFSSKRFIGRNISELEQISGSFPYIITQDGESVPIINTVAGPKTASEVSAEILKSLYDRAKKCFACDIHGAIITVPAYFDDAQRQATKDSAKLAGINVYRLLNEPTAAAIAYGLNELEDKLVAVFDLGGGTFDISILRIHEGVFEVLATGGDASLGGDDFDRSIAEWTLTKSSFNNKLTPNDYRTLMLAAKGAKEKLTMEKSAFVDFITKKKNNITRKEFEKLITPLIEKILLVCKKTLLDADFKPIDMDDVVLVGGATRIPCIQKSVHEFFGVKPLSNIDPDRVVAIGAATHANVLAGNAHATEMLLLDVTPLSLGVETMGGIVEKIVHRNTTIPVEKTQQFTTYKDGQTAMSIHVVQGEREMVSDCRSLAKFELRDIPPLTAGAARIAVTYQVDADGLLNVKAYEESKGVEANVEVKPSFGLTDAQITSMIKDSNKYADTDMLKRSLQEKKVEASRTLEAIKSALLQDGDQLLSGKERENIDQCIAALESTKENDNSKKITTAIEILEKETEFYVERRMNASIKKAVEGRNIDEFKS
jgi:molecular chaperone HscA